MGMMRPISLSERIRELDVLRGVALFGIIAANMRAFNSPQPTYMDHTLMWTGMADRIAQVLIDLFVSGKFITHFDVDQILGSQEKPDAIFDAPRRSRRVRAIPARSTMPVETMAAGPANRR